MDYQVKFFLKDAKYQIIWPIFYINTFIFNRKFHKKIFQNQHNEYSNRYKNTRHKG